MVSWTSEDEKKLNRLLHLKAQYIESQNEVVKLLERAITKIKNGEHVNFTFDVDMKFIEFNKIKLEVEYYET